SSPPPEREWPPLRPARPTRERSPARPTRERSRARPQRVWTSPPRTGETLPHPGPQALAQVRELPRPTPRWPPQPVPPAVPSTRPRSAPIDEGARARFLDAGSTSRSDSSTARARSSPPHLVQPLRQVPRPFHEAVPRFKHPRQFGRMPVAPHRFHLPRRELDGTIHLLHLLREPLIELAGGRRPRSLRFQTPDRAQSTE